MVALHWIGGQSSCWKPFVANRVAEIQLTWDPDYWKYCPSKEKPPDLLTRGLTCGGMEPHGGCFLVRLNLLSCEMKLPSLNSAKRKEELPMVVPQF